MIFSHRVGECGFTFAPAVFNRARKTENFSEQQLFAIDIDEKVTFTEIKKIADRYRLPVLLAYGSFSWTDEQEKFRVVFAMDKYDESNYTAKIHQFYNLAGVEMNGKNPVYRLKMVI